MTENAAKERDLDKRKTLYLEVQRKFQMEAPFTMMFQASDQGGVAQERQGLRQRNHVRPRVLPPGDQVGPSG